MNDLMTDATSSLTFVGTATTVLRFGETTIMTDPNFLRRGQRAYLGWGLSSRRLTDPVVPDPLPKLAPVLLSHLHGDHWDRVAENTLPPQTPILTTHAARRILVRRGVDAHGLRDWDERLNVDGATTVRVTAVPAVHARGLMGKLLPPVLGSIVAHRAANVRSSPASTSAATP